MFTRSTRSLLSGLSLALLLASLPASAAIRRVKHDAPGPAHDGQTWATAYLKVSEALSAAAPGDEVWVTAGTYAENITLTSGLALYGGFRGTEAAREERDFRANVTTLDGGKAGTVVTIPATVTVEAIVDGFTIRNGFARETGGGGIRSNGVAVIRNNVITDNRASGICTDGTCTSASGGGIASGGTATIVGNTIINNGANDGGGLAVGGDVTVRDNLIARNIASAYRLTGFGGGLIASGSGCRVLNNTIADNRSDNGAGIYSNGATVVNNVLYNNTMASAPDIIDDWRIEPGTVFHHNCVTPGATMPPPANNIQADPLFADPASGNYRLNVDSPCIDAGDDTVIQSGETDLDGNPRIRRAHVDIGAYEMAPVRFVKHDAPGPAHDGTTWATAFQTVQAGIDAAANGDEIWVAAGTYAERITVARPLGMYGGFGGNETARADSDPAANASILDGGASGTVVTLTSAAVGATLDGFTVRNGKSEGAGGVDCAAPDAVIAHNTITGNLSKVTTGNYIGVGGLRVTGAGARVLENTVAGNTSEALREGPRGGGVRIEAADVEVTGNTIVDNTATGLGVAGGGLFIKGRNAVVRGNFFGDNEALADAMEWAPSSTSALGPGAYVGSNEARVEGNVFTGNYGKARAEFCHFGCYGAGEVSGGGLYVAQDALDRPVDILVAGNVMARNRLDGNGPMRGGGLFIGSVPAMVRNNTIVENGPSTATEGSGVAAYSGSNHTLTFANNIVAFNGETGGGPGVLLDGLNVVFHHNDVFGNVPANYKDKPADPAGANGNISADPLFADRAAGNYRLLTGSPAIDAGDSSLVSPGETDLGGGKRLIGPAVDMGAYEAPVYATLADAVLALKTAGGLETVAAADFARLNIAWSIRAQVDVGDAVALVRKAVGLGQ